MANKVKWAKGVFSKELADLAKQACTEAIGKTIICEDGTPRRCVTLSHSMRWPWKMVLNEEDPESKMGHFVHVLSLCAQLTNQPLPDGDAIEAFNKVMRVKFEIKENGSFARPPEQQQASRIFVPKRDIN